MDAVNAQFINKQIQYYFIYSMGIYKQVYKQNNSQPIGTLNDKPPVRTSDGLFYTSMNVSKNSYC